MILTAIQIDQAFEGKEHQYDALTEIYRLVYPDWNDIQSIEGYPTVGEILSSYIWMKFVQFDKIHHPDIIKGGLWMSKGFSTSKKLDDWEVDLSTAEVYY